MTQYSWLKVATLNITCLITLLLMGNSMAMNLKSDPTNLMSDSAVSSPADMKEPFLPNLSKKNLSHSFLTKEERELKNNFTRYQNTCPYDFGLQEDTTLHSPRFPKKKEQRKILYISTQESLSNFPSSKKPTVGELKKIEKKGFIKHKETYITILPQPQENQPALPSPFFATLRTQLPAGEYILDPSIEKFITKEDLLAWTLAGYTYQFSKSTWEGKPVLPTLIIPKKFQIYVPEILKIAEVTNKFRDAMQTRTNQYTPAIGAAFMHDLANAYKNTGASAITILGKELRQNFEAVYEVGKGSKDAPNVTILTWSHPKPLFTLDLVGKGVCFDTGGNNLKTNPSLMYMDKGGALAHNALAELIMDANLPIELRVGNAWVVNSPGGTATNTHDIYKIGNLTVENKNTDAEGRLIMAAVLAYFDQHSPAEYTITQATLTGAALSGYGNTAVVYGPKGSDNLISKIMKAMNDVGDPAWQGPRDTRHLKDLKNTDADLANMGGLYGGSSIADQFLCQFASEKTNFIHIDSACATIDGSTGITPGVTSGDLFGVRGTYEFLKDLCLEKANKMASVD